MVFSLDSHGNPVDVHLDDTKGSDILIEEFMLIANYLAAEFLVESVRSFSFLRRHPTPHLTHLGDASRLATGLGHSLDTSSHQSLKNSLVAIGESDKPALQALSCLLARPIPPAQYFVVDKKPSDRWRHYALSLPYYTHFTSPIRRYSDIVVHRLIIKALETRGGGHHSGDYQSQDEMYFTADRLKDLVMVAETCNSTRASSKSVERRSQSVHFTALIQQRGFIQTVGIIIKVSDRSFAIYVPQYGLDKEVYLDSIPHVLSSFSRAENRLLLTREEDHHRKHQDTKHHTGEDNIESLFSEVVLEPGTHVLLRITSVTSPQFDIKFTLLDTAPS
jgi:exoribonuclease R